MVETLGINFVEIICAIINFLILFGLLSIFLYKPTLNMFERRRNAIKNELEGAAAVRAEADKLLENYNQRISDVEYEVGEIVKASKAKAENEARLIIKDAKAEAMRLKKSAEADIERESQEAMTHLKGEIGKLAILAAEQILEREVCTPEGQEEYINGILEQAGRV